MIKTVTTTAGVNTVLFDEFKRYFWIRNIGENVVYASAYKNVSPAADNSSVMNSGDIVRVDNVDNPDVYIYGESTVEVHATDEPNCPFKVGGKGGDSPDLSLYAKKSDIQNENLLMNPDFKINQRGVSGFASISSSGFTYGVDRWVLEGVGEVTVNSDGTLTVKGTISQILENAVGTNVTASIGIISGTATANYDDTAKKFSITGDNAVISWAKLEYGNIATPFVTPDPATELMKCQRYCIALPPTRYSRATYVGATTLIFSLSLPTTMRCIPSIESGKVYILDVSKPYGTQVDKSYNITINSSGHSGIINFTAQNASATASIDSCLYVTENLVLSADL